MKKLIFSTLSVALASSLFAGVSSSTNASGFYEISDSITSDTTLDSSKEYLLTNTVYVEGAVLTIPAGTVIRGRQGVRASDGLSNLQDPGSLVITKSGEINAVGTPASPIIFTYEFDADPVNNPTTPMTQDANRTLNTGFWGGIIILGNAPTNNDESGSNSLKTAGTDSIEGIAEPNPSDENPDLRGMYGGQDPHDSSGIMKYVSIRNGGFKIGADNEINGLTMGGVGDGTVLEYIEVIAGQDDGFEWFGGTVNSKYLLSAYNNDDSFDYDQGFCGQGQFWATVQCDNGVDGDKGGEFDGDDQAGALPRAVPAIYNMTVIGGKNGQIDYDKDAGGYLYNSISVDATTVMDINTSSAAMQTAGLLKIDNNVWCADSSDASGGTAVFEGTLPSGANNVTANPYMGGAAYLNLSTLARDAQNGVTWKPSQVPAVVSNLAPYTGNFFTAVTYKGAFSPVATAWTAGWTVGSQLGYFVE